MGFGSWEALKGRVVVGYNESDEDFNKVGKTGGSKAHKHEQTLKFESTYNDNTGLRYTIGESVPSEQIYTKDASSLMPYAVTGYMWVRTA